MEPFKASVQYGDWEGTAAADDTAPESLEPYLKKQEDEVLIAVSVGVEGSQPKKLGHVFIRAFLFKGPATFDELSKALDSVDGDIPVRQVDIELSLVEFISLFQRFDVMLTGKGLPLENRTYRVVDE